MESNKKIFIGTVGYHILTNHSIGPVLLPQLKALDWPQNVQVDELNWGPIAVVQQFQALKRPYDRVVLLTAVNRPSRKVGEISIFKWQGELPDEKQIQACVGDAATGVISIENLLVIGEYFKIWPKELFVVDVEPGEEQAGDKLTPEMAEKIPDILGVIKDLAKESNKTKQHVMPLRGTQLFHHEKN